MVVTVILLLVLKLLVVYYIQLLCCSSKDQTGCLGHSSPGLDGGLMLRVTSCVPQWANIEGDLVCPIIG